MANSITYSFVIPILNEEETIPELWYRLESVIEQLDETVEVIFVDDGSSDRSFELLAKLNQHHSEIKILSLSRNFGHQCALSAGIDHAEGKAVILMDGDLQDAPEAILDFIAAWRDGYEVVYAIRKKRKESLLKRVAFKSFYRIQSAVSGINLPLDAGIFSLMDRKVVLSLRNMPERNKYISGLRVYSGFKQIGIPVERNPRFAGEPRVGLVKLFKLAFDGIFSFSTLPLRLATWLGLFFSLGSFLIGILGLIFKFVLSQKLLGWEHGLTTIFFIGGIQLMCLGVVGEYIGRIYEEVKQRPYYIIGRKVGFSKETD